MVSNLDLQTKNEERIWTLWQIKIDFRDEEDNVFDSIRVNSGPISNEIEITDS
jgi:hypothetical protein